MPIYEYRCSKGHVFETMQSILDDPLTECERCGEPVERVFHPVAVHFKGSGFYNTDYGKQRRSEPKSAEKSGESGSKKSGDSSKSESKPPASSGKSDSSSS